MGTNSKVKKLPNWERRLEVFLYSCGKTEYQKGKTDCVPFIGNVLYAITGINPALKYQATYSSEKEANNVISRTGLSFEELVTKEFSELGLEEADSKKPLRFADIGFLIYEKQQGLGIYNGRLFITPGKTGLTYVFPSTASRIWRVPC